MLGQARRKRLDVIDRILPRERVHGVLHRVGRQTAAVVAFDIDPLEGTLERDTEREIDQVVRIGTAANLHQPHVRFAISVPAQSGHHRARIPGTEYRAPSTEYYPPRPLDTSSTRMG